MDVKETRVDMREMTPEELAVMQKQTQLMYQLNHTMPATEEYAGILRELFGENLGKAAISQPRSTARLSIT